MLFKDSELLVLSWRQVGTLTRVSQFLLVVKIVTNTNTELILVGFVIFFEIFF